MACSTDITVCLKGIDLSFKTEPDLFSPGRHWRKRRKLTREFEPGE